MFNKKGAAHCNTLPPTKKSTDSAVPKLIDFCQQRLPSTCQNCFALGCLRKKLSSSRSKCKACRLPKIWLLSILHPAVKDANALLERESSEGIGSPSRDDDSSLLNPVTHSSSIIDENTKSDACIPEVSSHCIYYHEECKVKTPLLKDAGIFPSLWVQTPSPLFFVHLYVRGGVNPAAFASAMERAVSTTSWFTGSPARSQRRGRFLSVTSGQRAYRWRRR